MKKTIAAVFCCLTVTAAWGGERQFQWDDLACSYSGYYDDLKITKPQIDAVYDLIYQHYGISHIYVLPVSTDPDEVAYQDIQPFKEQCARAIGELERLSLPTHGEFARLRQASIADYKQYCRVGEIAWHGMRDPERLRAVNKEPRCQFYVDALTGKNDLLKTWKKVMYDELCAQFSGNVADADHYCRQPFENKMASERRLEYARADLLAYAWWNQCVKIGSSDADTIYRRAENAFLGLLNNVHQVCDFSDGDEEESMDNRPAQEEVP